MNCHLPRWIDPDTGVCEHPVHIECLDCGHVAGDHDDTAEAPCLMNCPCDGLHLDLGDCVPECFEVSYRSCDRCDKVEFHDECSPFDWVNGVCEDCDPNIVFLPENAWRMELA